MTCFFVCGIFHSFFSFVMTSQDEDFIDFLELQQDNFNESDNLDLYLDEDYFNENYGFEIPKQTSDAKIDQTSTPSNSIEFQQLTEETAQMGNSNYSQQAMQLSDSGILKRMASMNEQSDQFSGETRLISGTSYSNQPQNSLSVQFGQISGEAPHIPSIFYLNMTPNSQNSKICRTYMPSNNGSIFYPCENAGNEVFDFIILHSRHGYQVSGHFEGTHNANLSNECHKLDQHYYQLFGYNKVSKKCIFQYHNSFVEFLNSKGINPGMKKVSRNEYRSLSLYYKNNCKYLYLFITHKNIDLANKIRQENYPKKN